LEPPSQYWLPPWPVVNRRPTTLVAVEGMVTERVGIGVRRTHDLDSAAGVLGDTSSGRLEKTNSVVTCQPAEA